MPKTKFQEIIFTIMMVFMMVYFMICYNISLNIGGMTNQVFLMAFQELVIMAPVAFILDFFIVGHLAKKKAFQIVDLENDHPFHLVIAISVVSIILMCPCMSFAATLLFKNVAANDCSLVTNNSYEFPYGIFLTIMFCRTNRKICLW